MFPFHIPVYAIVSGIVYEATKGRNAEKKNKVDSPINEDSNVIDIESRWVDDPLELPHDPKTLHSR